MFYKYNLLHWFYVSMYIGSHHKLKDTFIVFKEIVHRFAAQQPQVTSIHNLLVGSAEELRTVLENTVSAVKTPVFIVYVTASTPDPYALGVFPFSCYDAKARLHLKDALTKNHPNRRCRP